MSTPGGIERLFAAKRRPPDKGIVLLLDDAAQAATAGAMTTAASALADALLAGRAHASSSRSVPTSRGRRHSPAARRRSAYACPITRRRVRSRPGSGRLPTTSANVSGLPEASDAAAILDQLGDSVDLVLDGGPARGGPASTVVDCSGSQPAIIRAGAVSTARIAAVLDAAGVEHGLRETDPTAGEASG